MSQELAPKTGADTSLVFIVTSEHPATIRATGLAGVEVITLEHLVVTGGAYEPVPEGGSNITLSVDDVVKKVVGQGQYRLNKPITAGVCGLRIDDGSETGTVRATA